RCRVHDAAQADPPVGRRAHRAVLTGGIDGGPDAPHWSHVRCRPPRDGELGVLCEVAAAGAVVVFVEDSTVGADQDCTEWCMSAVKRGTCQLHTMGQPFEISLTECHRSAVYGAV